MKVCWERFDYLPERRELDHILILNKTLADAGRSALQRLNGGIRYGVFINKLSGKDAVRDLILSSIDTDMLDLIENGDLSLKSLKILKKFKRKKSAMKRKSEIHVHIIYDTDKPDIVGVHVGSAERLAFRVEYHIGEHEQFIKPQKGSARNRKKKPRRQSALQNFWAREGYKDCWLYLVELDFPKSAKAKRRTRWTCSCTFSKNTLRSFFARCPGNYCNAFYLMASTSVFTDGLA